MFDEKMILTQNDREALAMLSSFLPDRIFDAHCHLFDTKLLPALAGNGKNVVGDLEKYRSEMNGLLCLPKTLRLNAISYPDASMKDFGNGILEKSDNFLIEQLDKDPSVVGEIVVHPKENAEDIEKRLVRSSIRGLKCYHNLSSVNDTWNADIGDYLPESAWEVADKHGLVITLHMVKDDALANESNLKYIREKSAKYPNAVLILAHCARSFASWTGVENVCKLIDRENVFFDFSAVCESPAMFMILKKIGVSRSLWGSDYPVCRDRGKCISLGSSFYWIYQKDLDSFSSKTKMSDLLIGLENLLAVRQAFIMADLRTKDAEDFFFNNAVKLFDRR